METNNKESKTINLSLRIDTKTLAVIARYFAKKDYRGRSLNLLGREGLEGFGELIKNQEGGIETTTEAFEILKRLGYYKGKKVGRLLVKELSLDSMNEKSFKKEEKVDGLGSVMDEFRKLKEKE
jgi:hypothetical protein